MDIFLLSWIIAAWLMRAGANLAYAVRGKPPVQVQRAAAKAALEGGKPIPEKSSYSFGDYWRGLWDDTYEKGKERRETRRELGHERRQKAEQQREKRLQHRQDKKFERQNKKMGEVPDETADAAGGDLSTPPDAAEATRAASESEKADVTGNIPQEQRTDEEEREAPATKGGPDEPMSLRQYFEKKFGEEEVLGDTDDGSLATVTPIAPTHNRSEPERLTHRECSEEGRGLGPSLGAICSKCNWPLMLGHAGTCPRRETKSSGDGRQESNDGGTMTATSEVTGLQSGIQHCKEMVDYFGSLRDTGIEYFVIYFRNDLTRFDTIQLFAEDVMSVLRK